jgi:radical SAM protein with 4Fe4S-binding SPASM domain
VVTSDPAAIGAPADPLSPSERRALLESPRPRTALPLLSRARRSLPLAPEARDVDRSDRPIYAVWEITLKCDLACRHCGSRAGAERPDELSLTEALDLVRQLAQLGVKELTLIGGEAYLYPGWTEVIREIRKNGMQSTLVTAGRDWTIERARAAKEAGLQSVSVSIDGTEASHDRLRGLPGAYRAARRALENARAAGLPVSVNTQVNRLSMPDLDHVHDVVREVGAHGWQLQLTVPAGRAADEPDVILQPYDLLVLFPLMARLKGECDEEQVKLLAGNNIGYFGPFDHVIRQMTPCGHSWSCGAGRLGLGIESNGDIKGCPSLPSETFVGGNVREHSLRDIWERSQALRFNRDRTVNDLWGFCRTCYYADECRGGCTWMSSSLFGRSGNNPYCHHRTLELQASGRRERMTRVAAAPGTPFDHGLWEITLEDVPGTRPLVST